MCEYCGCRSVTAIDDLTRRITAILEPPVGSLLPASG